MDQPVAEEYFRFGDLPPEVQLNILSLCDPTTLARFSTASRATHESADYFVWLRSFENCSTIEMVKYAKSVNRNAPTHVIQSFLDYEKNNPDMLDTNRGTYLRGLAPSANEEQLGQLIDATVRFNYDAFKTQHLLLLVEHTDEDNTAKAIDAGATLSNHDGSLYDLLRGILQLKRDVISQRNLNKIIALTPSVKHLTFQNPDLTDEDQTTAEMLLDRAYNIKPNNETVEQIIRAAHGFWDNASKSRALLEIRTKADDARHRERRQKINQGVIRSLGRINNEPIKEESLREVVPHVANEPLNIHEIVRASRTITGHELRGNLLLNVVNHCSDSRNLNQIRNEELDRFGNNQAWITRISNQIDDRLRRIGSGQRASHSLAP